MTQSTAALLVEFLLASFFAVACIKAHGLSLWRKSQPFVISFI